MSAVVVPEIVLLALPCVDAVAVGVALLVLVGLLLEGTAAPALDAAEPPPPHADSAEAINTKLAAKIAVERNKTII